MWWLQEVMVARRKIMSWLSDVMMAHGKSLWRNSRKIRHVVNFKYNIGSWKILVKKLTKNSSRLEFQMLCWLVENLCEETHAELLTLWLSDATLARGKSLWRNSRRICHVVNFRCYVGSWKIFVKKLTENSSRREFQMLKHRLVENSYMETKG